MLRPRAGEKSRDSTTFLQSSRLPSCPTIAVLFSPRPRFQVIPLSAVAITSRVSMTADTAFLFFFTVLVPAAVSIICNPVMFGIPVFNDCVDALQSIRSARPPPASWTTDSRLFVEPQFLNPPFALVSPNPFNNDIVQLPKIWGWSKSSYSSEEGCLLFGLDTFRYAFMSMVSPAGHVDKPASVTTW